MTFIITSYGTSMMPKDESLPESTTEEEAIVIAKEMKADPYAGFACLKEVRMIRFD